MSFKYMSAEIAENRGCSLRHILSPKHGIRPTKPLTHTDALKPLKDYDTACSFPGMNVFDDKLKNPARRAKLLIENAGIAFLPQSPVHQDGHRVKISTQKNPRYPNFEHKITREALWFDGRNNPNWVISQLAILDSRMGSLQDKERKPVSFTYAADFITSDA